VPGSEQELVIAPNLHRATTRTVHQRSVQIQCNGAHRRYTALSPINTSGDIPSFLVVKGADHTERQTGGSIG